MPKSDTLTSLFSATRQFLAACRKKGELRNRTETDQKSRSLMVYQVSVNEVGALQVSHPLADIQTHL